MTENLKHIPEFNMTIDELHEKIELLAERREKLTQELCNLDVEVAMITTIMTTKAMKELGHL